MSDALLTIFSLTPIHPWTLYKRLKVYVYVKIKLYLGEAHLTNPSDGGKHSTVVWQTAWHSYLRGVTPTNYGIAGQRHHRGLLAVYVYEGIKYFLLLLPLPSLYHSILCPLEREHDVYLGLTFITVH